ncbi:GntP family permease [Nesterenkonia halotolerans]|uniref:GntP family gluconate:H+ symporter n=1 Tax=Nesterenkonia halotolerans TaxID=225325 RepID=A0ABR9J6B4_9MICC|nr:SLC13 family permease [Nesterenkonia halotolerans]MBE1514450.1 GntP family gluconate:H+ symporter [Nesterenkonia halotolerans]
MSDVYVLSVFLAAVIALVLLIARLKVHPVATLFIVVVALGLALGMGGAETVALVNEGFGNTMASVGLLVILGCVLGKLLELSGAALKITETALKLFSEKRVPWAIALASSLIGIPLIADSAVIMLIPVVSMVAAQTGISMMKLGPILYIGAYVMTSVVPPGPGPLASASLLGVGIGEAILYGLAVGVPGIIAATLYLLTTKTHVNPKPEFVNEAGDLESALPQAHSGTTKIDTNRISLASALAPVLAPIALITISAFVSPLLPEGSVAYEVLTFIGAPVVALFLGCLLVLPMFGRRWKDKETLNDMFEGGLRVAALPLALTGVGGALALLIRETGVAENVATGIQSIGIAPLLIPFLVAAAVCTITGSNILGVMTAAAIMEPLMDTLGLAPIVVYLSCATGAQIMKHANSSGFWVTTTLSNMTVGQGIRSIGVASLISGVTGFLVLNLMVLTGVV